VEDEEQQQQQRGGTSDTEGKQQQQPQHKGVESAGEEDELARERAGQRAERSAALASLGRGEAPPPPSYRSFSKSGINAANPFQSRRAAVLATGSSGGGHPSGARAHAAPVDRFQEREEARRRDREDELYFNAKYARGRVPRSSSNRNNCQLTDEEEGEEPRSDADYAFLKRNKSELPLRDLSEGQRSMARQIEDEGTESARRRALFRRGGGGSASASTLPSRARSASQSAAGGGARLSDDGLLRSIDEMERFLARSKREAASAAGTGPFSTHDDDDLPPRWKRQLDAMGGPERAGRRNAGIETHELFGGEEDEEQQQRFGGYGGEDMERLQERYGHSPRRAHSAREGYAAATVSSAPFGRPSPFRTGGVRAQSHSRSRSPRHRARRPELELEADRALDHLAQREGDYERRIAYLEDFLDGRRVQDGDDDGREHKVESGRVSQRSSGSQGKSPGRGLGHFASERLFSSAAGVGGVSHGGSPVRIPSQHPHRTGKNHVPSSCVYCRREADLRSWSNEARRLVARAFPERKLDLGRKDEDLDGLGKTEAGAASGVHSRLRPLAKRMLDSTRVSPRKKDAAAAVEFPISADVDAHFLSQLSAAERRRQASRLDSLWYLVSRSDRDKQVQLRRIARDIEAEAARRHAHMAWLEEQAIERTLRHTVSDKAAQREVQRMLTEQAQHVAQLLDLKRQSLQNYARDQVDLVAEQQRVSRQTAKLRAQNDRHSLREMQRQLREQDELAKQRKMDQLRHAEEKFAFKLSQLRRPQFAAHGIRDLDEWAVGRG
jgi:hypothetical protein